MSKVTLIKFVKGCPPYNVGECAGLTPEKLAAVPAGAYVLVEKKAKFERVEVKPESTKGKKGYKK